MKKLKILLVSLLLITTFENVLAQIPKDNINKNLYYLIGVYSTHSNLDTINDSNVFNFIKQTKAWYPEVIFAQFKLESASGTSDVFKHSNNLFGMKIVRSKRPTTQIDNQDYKSYGIYKNWQCSVLDRVLWDFYYIKKKPINREAYLLYLRIYAEDPNYINKINKIIKL